MSNWTILGIISQQASATMKKYQLGTGKEYSGTIRVVPDEPEGSQAGQNRVSECDSNRKYESDY